MGLLIESLGFIFSILLVGPRTTTGPLLKGACGEMGLGPLLIVYRELLS